MEKTSKDFCKDLLDFLVKKYGSSQVMAAILEIWKPEDLHGFLEKLLEKKD